MPIITLAEVSRLVVTAGQCPADLPSFLHALEARQRLAALKTHPAFMEPLARQYLDHLPFWD